MIYDIKWESAVVQFSLGHHNPYKLTKVGLRLPYKYCGCFMSESVLKNSLDWNNNISVAAMTSISYDYMLQFEKEVTFVWGRPWSVMTYLYLAVRYFGILVAITCASWGGLFYISEGVSHGLFLLMQWSFSIYFCLAEVILIWRLYALYNQSKPLLHILVGFFIPVVALYVGVDAFLWSRPSAISMQVQVIIPDIKYCTTSFHIGPMPAIYASIPVIFYDIFLVVLAIAALGKHLKERRGLGVRPNIYVIMIVRYHVLYFVLNLASQIFMALLWSGIPPVERNLVLLFNNTVPFIIVPRLIINIWETHANDDCVHVSTTFEDCICFTSPPELEQHEMESLA
ncbi:hypothetical protein P692DRAFT_20803648 [Suillus brevipes Sb2]|nr:hypothetical protein P692DRAFT_20803648 [Suillus brevipes Sb2]